MVTPKTGMPRGRPRVDFLNDPERIACALGRALMSFGVSENDSFRRMAALIHGKEVGRQQIGARHKRGRGYVPAGTSVTYETKAIKGGSSASLVGKASTLRKKATDTQADPKAAIWLSLWSHHLAGFLDRRGPVNLEASMLFIIELAEQINNGTLTEAQFLIALNSLDPDFTPNV
jgi:hypothetical protein